MLEFIEYFKDKYFIGKLSNLYTELLKKPIKFNKKYLISLKNGSLLRSKLVIPNTVEFYERTAITKVGPIDQMNVSFSFVPYQQAIYSGNGKFTKNVIYCFLHENRMYLKVTGQAAKMLKYINIHGIFEDPTELSNFTNINGEACYSEDSKYPVNQWMVPFIKEQVLNQIIKGGQLPEDTSNDATQNKVQSGE
jgi:hypothetical protein